MSAPLETRAEELWPGDRVRRGHRQYELARVFITDREPVRCEARRIVADADSLLTEEITISWGELVMRVLS